MTQRQWNAREIGKCPVCGGAIWQKYGPGRRKRYCKNACRQIAYRVRKFERAAAVFKAARG